MNFKLIVTSCFALITSITYSQSKLLYTASGDAIKKGIKAHDKENYKSALKYYDKVHEGDTNYHWAQYEKATTYLAMEEYAKCIEIAEKEILNENHVTNDFYNLLGNAYDESDDKEKALQTYAAGIKKFPTYHQLFYNRAITYERMDKFQECIDDIKSTLRYNPFHANSHLKLATYAKEQGEIAKAMMCYNSFFILSGHTGSELLSEYNEYLNEQYDNDAIEVILSKDNYEDIDEMLASGATKSKKYKTPNKLSLPMVKQNYLLFTELQKRTLGDGFWDEFYVPFFIQIMADDKFNDLMYYQLRTATNNGIVSVLNKNIKSIRAFPEYAGPVWKSTHSDRKEMYRGEMTMVHYFWNGSSAVEGRGVVQDDEPTGTFEYFFSSGRLNAIGNYDMDGERNGEWVYYHQNGERAGIEKYDAGDLTGYDSSFYDNGILKSVTIYEDGKPNGIEKNYYSTGILMNQITYANSEVTGPAKYYNAIGIVEHEFNYDNENISGDFKKYYDNGQVAEEVQFVDSKRSGSSKEYYKNGQKKSESTYSYGELDGSLTTWYSDGTLRSEAEYKDGVLINTRKDYFQNGKLESEESYDENGKKTGVYSEYDKEGNLNLQLEFKKGDLIAYKVFHRDGSIIKEAKKQKGNFLFENFYSDGTQKAIGSYIPGDEGKDGVWKFYDKNGAISSESSYAGGEQYGQEIDYYSSGKKRATTKYKNGKANGLYVEYYANGQVAEQGYYLDNQKEGVWMTYRNNGTVKAENFYVENERNGPQKYYSVNGKLDIVDYLNDGTHEGFEVFDTNETPISKVMFTGDSTMYTVLFQTGEKLREFHKKGKVYHGLSTNYYTSGQISSQGNYFNNSSEGTWTYYHENGKVSSKGEYENDHKQGEWNYYYDNGTKSRTETYKNGQLHGLKTWYHDNGKKDIERTYEYGQSHGLSYYYDREGSLQHIRKYFYGKVTAYSYLGKDEQPVEMIPITNETCDCKSFFSNGKESRVFSMQNGNFNGDYIEYYKNGQIASKSTYINDMREGMVTSYYANGNLMKEQPNVNNVTEGVVKHYNEDGSLSKTETYIQDVLHGPTVYYTNGKIEKTVMYYDGYAIQK